MQPIFGTSWKDKGVHPPIIYQQCNVNLFTWHLCNADYVGYNARRLHQSIFKHKNSAVGKQLLDAHGSLCYLTESQFWILRKSRTKFKCLVCDMLFNLRTQSTPQHNDRFHPCETPYYKLIAIFRRQYHIVLTASWEKMYSVLGGVARRRSPIRNIFSRNSPSI